MLTFDFIVWTFIFIFGTIIGSFLNVVILRYNTGESIVSGKSACFSCAKSLPWYEMFPVLSFIALRGKCGNCKSKISWQYPLVEFFTGVFFLLAFFKVFNHSLAFGEFIIGSSLLVLYYWIIFSLLIIIFVYDYRHKMIPDLPLWIFNGLGFLSLIDLKLNILPFLGAGKFISIDWSSLFAGFVLSAFFASIWLVSRGRWMGFGDVKLVLGIGWFLGLVSGISAVILGFWIGAAVSLILLFLQKLNLRGKSLTIKSEIPFAPFLILGLLSVFFLGFDVIGLSSLLAQ